MHRIRRLHYALLCLIKSILIAQMAISVAFAQQVSPPSAPTISLNNDPLPALAEFLEFSPDPFSAPGAAMPPSTQVAAGIRPVQSTVEVNANSQTLREGLAVAYHVTQADVLSAAGTWEDFTRYLQVLPGVVWNTDMSNDVMIRGGQPSENLYVVDGIEVPNINHLAVEGTTGGFTSMIDTASISSVDLKAGTYDARYSSRLSSLIEIHTRESQGAESAGELEVGIAGVGGFMQRPIGKNASLLLSGHRSVLNLVTNDIGLNGVPIYTNGLARLEWSPNNKDHFSVLSLSGADSIAITPQPCDGGVTLDVQTQYSGIRSTNGLIWQHLHSSSAISTLTASHSSQSQDIGQQKQSPTNTRSYGSCLDSPYLASSVYQEQTSDDTPSLGYGLQVDKWGWLFSAGTTGRLASMNYKVAQPLGQQSPFNANSTLTDANSFTRNLSAGQTGTYIEATGHLGARGTLIAGAREETFALTGAHVFEPRASLAFRLNEHQAINGSYSLSGQLAPSINILSYAQNTLLRPLRVEQFSVGADLWRMDWATISIETYRKRYTNEPVSTEYPSLMLANMVDTLGQQFVWLPLKSGGRGQASGVELLLRAHLASRFQLLGSLSYARTRYAAADGVMRPGNFDFPLVANGLATVRLPANIQLSFRNTYASGRPYTPFNVPLSEKQSRGIYDLTRINAERGPAYNRIDADVNRSFRIHRQMLDLHAGVENALDRQNFLGYAWMDNCAAPWKTCGMNVDAVANVPETKVTQMPIFPSAGLRYSF
jgi:hypothetical protein